MPHAERVVHVDSSDVRVTEWRLGPGASTKHCCHTCDCVVVPLTSGRLRFRRADGDIVVDIVPGAPVLRSAPAELEALNDGADRIAFVEIELEDTARRLISA